MNPVETCWSFARDISLPSAHGNPNLECVAEAIAMYVIVSVYKAFFKTAANIMEET